MSPRPNVSEERKAQILQAAMQVFSRLGFNKARMEDIASETQLSKGTLYLYFKSKDDLIVAIISHLFDGEFEHMRTLSSSAGSASQQLMQMIDGMLQNLQTMLRMRPVLYEIYAASFRHQTIRDVMKGYYSRYLDLVIPILERGMQSGEFRALDAETAAIATGALMEGTILMWVYDPQRVDLSRHIHDSLEIFLQGLKQA